MPNLKSRFFIFAESQSHTVLLARRAPFGDSLFRLTGITVYETEASGGFQLPSADFRTTFEPARGVSARLPPVDVELDRLKLLRKKAEKVFLTGNVVDLVTRNFEAFYTPEALLKLALGPEAHQRLIQLARDERAILEKRADKFFRDFQERVDACTDASAVENQFRHLQHNVSIGPFSFNEGGAADEQRD